MTLAQVIEAGGGLRLRCAAAGCGAMAAADVDGLVQERLSDVRLGHLEERFRCGCGARRVVLEAGLVPRGSSSIFRWR